MTTIIEETGTGLSLAEMSAQLYARGWMEGTAGNISVRLPGGQTALITASGLSKGALTWRDVVAVRVCDAERVHAESPRPSAETTIHAALYRSFPDCHAVVHAHPPYATTVATLAERDGLDAVLFRGLELIKGLGGSDPAVVAVPVFHNWPKVAQIAREVGSRLGLEAAAGAAVPPALLLGGHGATTWGPTLEVARNRMECLEGLCQLTLLLDRR